MLKLTADESPLDISYLLSIGSEGLKDEFAEAEKRPRVLCPGCGQVKKLDHELIKFCDDCLEKFNREFEQACSHSNDLKHKLQQSGIPPRFWNCTLADFKPKTPSQQQALSIFPTDKSVTLCGTPYSQQTSDEQNTGVGKTHLITAYAIEKINQGSYVNFVRARSREFEELLWTKQSYAHLAHCDLLLLDDVTPEIGKQPAEHWLTGINEIVAQVYDENRCQILITTNLPFRKGQTSLKTIFGPRFISRLIELCTIDNIKSVTGPDHRLNHK